MMKRLAPVVSCAVWLAATAVQAQAPAPSAPKPDAPSPVAPVTVQAAAPPAVVKKQTQSFVQGYAAPTAKIDQIARWHGSVCVQISGVAADQAGKIAGRINEVAKEVGLHVLDPGCKANIVIVFTPQPQHLLDEVAAHREQALGFHYPDQLKQLKTVTHPIQAWYVTATAGGGGDSAVLTDTYITGIAPTGLWGAQPHEEVIDDPDNRPPTACGDSPHFNVCLESRIKNVFMVVDSSVVQGKDTGLLADYMTMLALSQSKSLDGCNALPSIIDLFGKTACPGRDAPDGLTPADATYLTALYASDPQSRITSEESDIAGRMASLLIKANAAHR
jgi:hypothetical protein